MAKALLTGLICLSLCGCSLRVWAAATVGALDAYSIAYIEAATLEERAELREMLQSIKLYTDQAAATVDARLALIDDLDEGN